ncbi:MAG: hypothetical protein PHD48_09685 [Alphaproteobacteria bacterium]|nr:hypothetical protein [Alphaproteobacteria bacterium]
MTQESLQQRQMQTRRFDTKDEKKLLTAGAQVLQDLGFNLEESETGLGVVVGSKDRDATEAGEVAGVVLMRILIGTPVIYDEKQKIRVSMVTRSVGDKETAARVTFQRVVWNNQGRVSATEPLNEPKLYQEFFDKLSQSVFLTANEI